MFIGFVLIKTSAVRHILERVAGVMGKWLTWNHYEKPPASGYCP
jgi:hypothetical protein